LRFSQGVPPSTARQVLQSQCPRMRSRSNLSEPGISTDVLRPVGAALARLGVDLDAGRMGDEGSFVPGSAADALMERASSQLRDEALGLTLAESIPMGALGLLDYALTTSSSLRDALNRVARYYALATQRVEMKVLEGAEGAQLYLERRDGISHSRHWIEFSLALIAVRMRQTISESGIVKGVDFVHDVPSDRRRHDSFFRVPVRFSQARDRIQLRDGALERPLITACASLAEHLDARLRELAPTSGDDPLLQSVRRVVSAGLDARDCSLDFALPRLRISRRTLQRELRKRGTSHHDILDQVRRERAGALLRQKTKLADVAFHLGFAQPSAFFKAFRRWTGRSPRAAVSP
jgi:AraC-like DNA-binding protein